MSVSALIVGKGNTLGRVPVHVNDTGAVYVVGTFTPSPGEVSVAISAAVEASNVIAAAPGTLFSVNVMNPTAADVYLHLFDAVAVPADGAIPVDFACIPANWSGYIDYGENGRPFATGIVAAISTSPVALALAGASFLFSARFV